VLENLRKIHNGDESNITFRTLLKQSGVEDGVGLWKGVGNEKKKAEKRKGAELPANGDGW